MKILLVGHGFSPRIGSEPGATWNWARNLSTNSEVWALVHPHDQEGVVSQLLKYPNPNLHVVFVKLRIRFDPWKPSRGKRGIRLHYVFWQRAVLKEAARLHAIHHFDIAHHVSWGTVSCPPLLWKLPIPLVWGPVGGGQTAPAAFRKYFGASWPSELLRKCRLSVVPYLPSVRAAAQASAAVLATNFETNNILQRAGCQRLEPFLDSGIPADKVPAVLPSRDARLELKVLWLGRFWRLKALPLALDALKLLTDLPIRLVVVGDGPMRRDWVRYACEQGLQSRVDFRGFLDWQNVFPLYREADIFLFTSLRDSFGGQLLEAMGQGLPIVTLNHQGAKAFVPQGAGIKVPVTYPDKTAEELAKAIRLLYCSPELRREMGLKAWQFAKSETWDNRAARAMEIYRRVLREQQNHIEGKLSASSLSGKMEGHTREEGLPGSPW